MSMLRFIFTFYSIALSYVFICAQDQAGFIIPLSNHGDPSSLEIEPYYASVHITGSTRKDIELIVEGRMKSGSQNADFLFDFMEEDNHVEIVKKGSARDKGLTLIFEVPYNCAISVDAHFAKEIQISGLQTDVTIKTQTGDIEVTDLNGNLEASTFDGEIRALEVKGSVILNNTEGDIYASLIDWSEDDPMALSNIHGNIELVIPHDSPATFQIQSFKGKVSSDFNFTMANRANRPGLKGVLREINGGGVMISVDNLRGDISINKK